MNNQTIILGGGCFWCTEAVFKMLKGISSVKPGYAGGTTPNPTYEQVCNGNTGHIEVVEIVYNPTVIALEDILTVFFASHDPSTPNRQGNDVGTQYRSAVLYTRDEQKVVVEKFVADINASSPDGKPIVTEIKKLEIFYPAEDYHQDYYSRNKTQGYCEIIINPKLDKVQRKFADLLKNI